MLNSLKSWIILAVLQTVYSTNPPHIVFVLVDDMGWNDVSFHGSDQIQTPNIDMLAYSGVILQQYYSEAICTPARAALLTGKYPMRLGMQGFPLFNSEDRGIPLSERLLPAYLKELGYATHLVGKWHVGMSRNEYLPTNRGYDSHYGMRGGFIDYYTYNKVERWPDGKLMFGLDLYDQFVPQIKEQRYIVDALTDRAVEVINYHNSSQPLFLHVTHNAPHAGNDGGALQPPLYDSVSNEHIANSDRRLYADVVTHLDKSIGRLVKTLADRGMLDNTMIIFASDNGAPTVGQFSNWGINLPFRGKKSTPWEGAVRVPAFVWHPSLRPKVWNGMMHITDWLPTLIAAAGGGFRNAIDGVNQWESIVGDKITSRKEVLIGIDDSSPATFAAYRAGDYKIVVGNVTGLNNGYYGVEFLPNKDTPPDYFSTLKSSVTAQIFERKGFYMDKDYADATRRATLITQVDPVGNITLCEPNPNKGCLFNLRKDPMESNDLWNKANRIAMLLTTRLRMLWSQRQPRDQKLDIEADPANFNYVWTPWLSDDGRTVNEPTLDGEINNLSQFDLMNRSDDAETTRAAIVNCSGTVGIKNFLCLFRNVL